MQDLEIKKQDSTLQTFEDDEVWEVSTGKKTFRLSGKQASVLKQASNTGHRGLAWFDGFAVSIAHIVSVKRLEDSKSAKDKKRSDFMKLVGTK